MRFVYKHTSGKYLKFANWSKTNVDDITTATIFDEDSMGSPPLTSYTYISYEKELRKLKLEKLYENR